MTPAELRRIREKSAPTQGAFARALGYRDAEAYRKYETSLRNVPPLLSLVADMIDRHGMPDMDHDPQSDIPPLLRLLAEMIDRHGMPREWRNRQPP